MNARVFCVILNGLRSSQLGTIISLYLVASYSEKPRLQRSFAAKLAEIFPGGEKYFLDDIVYDVISRKEATANVTVNFIGVTSDELRCSLAVFLQDCGYQRQVFCTWSILQFLFPLRLPQAAHPAILTCVVAGPSQFPPWSFGVGN